MQTELYADAIGEITVSGTIVRIDFTGLSATERDAANQPRSEHRQRVIMSVEGFANSFDVLQKAMNGLIEAGAIRRNEPVPLNGHTPQASSNGVAAQPHPSPNF